MSKLLHWVSSVQQTSNNNENARKDSNANTDASKTPPVKKFTFPYFFSLFFHLVKKVLVDVMDLN